jgi:hypothetical protein
MARIDLASLGRIRTLLTSDWPWRLDASYSEEADKYG